MTKKELKQEIEQLRDSIHQDIEDLIEVASE